MLPVRKEIQDEQAKAVSSNESAMLWPGKVVESVHDLRQRLQDIDLDQIAHAVDQLSELEARLLVLQRALRIISEVSGCQPKTLQSQDDVTQELYPLKVKILEALSQLQRHEETDRFVLLTHHQKSSVGTADQSVGLESRSSLPLDSMNSEFGPAAQFQEAQLEIDEPVAATQDSPRPQESAPATDTVLGTDATEIAAPILPGTIYPIPDPPTVAPGNERLDFAFLKRTTGATRDFDFTDDLLKGEKSDIFEEPHQPLSRQAEDSNSQDPPIVAADTMDFDKKLLDDLIKNYGEFAVSPEVPNGIEFSNSSEKGEHSAAPRPTNEPDTAINRSVPAYQTNGEFDRKLKKLIKDYGQVDLYSQHSSSKTKLRALAAFAVLGAVLSGIYYFSAPKSAGAPSASANQNQVPEAASEATVTDNSASSDTKTAVPAKDSIPIVGQVPPQNVEASETFGITEKQVIKKKLKKGGSNQ